MDLLLLFAVVVVAVIALLVWLGMWYPGNGNDLLDADPRERMERQAAMDAEDLAQLSELRRRHS